MRLKLMLFTAITCLSAVCLLSCKKESNIADTAAEIETTVDLSSKQAITEGFIDDANDQMVAAIENENLAGTGKVSNTNSLNCPTVTVTSLGINPSGFPKHITLDFGSGCSAPGSSIVRKGIINIVLSDSLRHAGTTAVMTFNNYFINGYKKEGGSITWTNQSTNSMKKWQRVADSITVTNPTGTNHWLHSGTKTITQIAGVLTPLNPMDDVFSITGTGTVTNASGVTRNSTITTALIKRRDCDWIGKGAIEFVSPNHTGILDYGDGTCNDQATLTIDNSIVRTITL